MKHKPQVKVSIQTAPKQKRKPWERIVGNNIEKHIGGFLAKEILYGRTEKK